MVSGVRRLFAWAALVAFATTFGLGASALGHSAGADDLLCEPGVASGHASPQIGIVKTTTVPTHCPFCHWQRVVGGASLAASMAGVAELHPAARVSPGDPGRVAPVYLSG